MSKLEVCLCLLSIFSFDVIILATKWLEIYFVLIQSEFRLTRLLPGLYCAL